MQLAFQDHQSFAADLIPTLSPFQRVGLSQVQDFTFIMVQFYEVCVGPIL